VAMTQYLIRRDSLPVLRFFSYERRTPACLSIAHLIELTSDGEDVSGRFPSVVESTHGFDI